MKLRRPAALTALTCVLLIVLPALAVLQYRWVGQVSDAERERMQRNLETAAFQYREAFDGEIMRAFLTLRLDTATVRGEAWDRYADRYATWADTAAHPSVVANVFLVDAKGDRLRFQRWDSTAHTFEPAAWAPELESSRAYFTRQLETFTANRRDDERPPFWDEEAVLVAPLVDPQFRRTGPSDGRTGPPNDRRGPPDGRRVFGFTVVALNLSYIRDQLLPELAQRHFTHPDGDVYRVAVTTTSQPPRIIFRSDSEAPVDPEQADAIEPLFGRMADPLVFFRGNPDARGGGPGERRRNVIIRMLRAPGGPDVRGPNEPDADTTIRGRFPERVGRWLLLVQHQSGSLEAAVGSVRRRNLAISFGVLLLLSVSVAMLTLSSRRAHRLARQQMEFVASVSHELRTPVAVIRSAAENLSQGVVGSPERVKRYGDTIGIEARRLGEMVERVLQYAGLEAGQALSTKTPLLPGEIIDAAIAAAAAIVTPDVTIERHIAPGLPPVLGDAVALRSAMENLIANAVKYGGADRWVGIRAERSGTGSRAAVRIVVEDHGPGIAAADLPHIFEPFYRGVDGLARQVQGNGLGLSIVKRIVEAHGGSIIVSTRPGGGSAFTVALPVADPTAPVVSLTSDPAPFGAPGGAAAHS